MNKKIKKDLEHFEWTVARIKESKTMDSLPKSLQDKLTSRKPKGPQLAQPN
jgi:hypothetical protein